jgi:uncharacterized membrane protein
VLEAAEPPAPVWHDGAAKGAVVVPLRRWEDFLALGITEIREYGATSIQVVRRLRALLEELAELVLPENRPAVAEELRRLDATVAAGQLDSIDLDLARSPDHQGIGGPSVTANASGDVAAR